jgi:2'-5' RNA ligase
MYRYYIGLSVTADIANHIQTVQKKWFDPTFIRPPLVPHVTLLAPPDVAQHDPKILSGRAAQAAKPFLPCALTLADVITFDYRAIVIRLESFAAHQIYSQLSLLALAKPRTFHPHITLAQATKGSRLPAKLLAVYRDELQPLMGQTFETPHLTLYTWLAPRTYSAKHIVLP